jgi:hypothetical protein
MLRILDVFFFFFFFFYPKAACKYDHRGGTVFSDVRAAKRGRNYYFADEMKHGYENILTGARAHAFDRKENK